MTPTRSSTLHPPRRASMRAALLSSVAVALALGLALACSGENPAGTGVDTWVSIPPQAGLVQAIGGDRVRVMVLVRPGDSPETYQPTPRQLAELTRADVFFGIGMPFEAVMLKKIQSLAGELPIVDTRQGIRLRPMSEPHHHGDAGHGDHDETGHDEHGEDEMDPHFWLDPRNDIVMAATIRDELIRLDPPGKAQYEANARQLTDALEQLDLDLREQLAPLRGRVIFVYHPSFGYFTDAYGLEQIAIEAGGREPGPQGLAGLIDLARARQVRVIFVQPQFDNKNAWTIAKAIDGAVAELDPLAPDILANLRAMAETIIRHYESAG